MAGLIIGIVGPIASGKGEITKAFENRGFIVYSLSNILRQEALKRGYVNPSARTTLMTLGKDLRKEHGDGVLVEMVMKMIQEDRENGAIPIDANIVIDSIRSPEEVRMLHESGAYTIGLIADQRTRWDRCGNRGRLGDPETFEDFAIIDDQELARQGVSRSLTLCNSLIDTTLIELDVSKRFLPEVVELLVRSIYSSEGISLSKEQK